MTDVSDRLAALGYTLPPPPKAGGSYDSVVVDGGVAYVAGQIAARDGELLATGIVGSTIDFNQACECARACALNTLSALVATLEDPALERVRRIAKLTVFVATGPEFDQHPAVANAASELLVAVLGEAGRHARSAVGVASLPRHTPVELDAVVHLR